MIEAELPKNERERLAALRAYAVLDTKAEEAFDDLTRIASGICGTPIALVSLVDVERQWFKSKVGLEASETPRSMAFCAHAILQPDQILVVPDSLRDERFFDNPLAVGAPHVRFYAGAPLVNPEGMPLGTLCVIDHQPRQLSPAQLDSLRALSRQVVSQLELRKANRTLRTLAVELERSNGELRQFTSVAAHDLQEPLRKLMSFSDLLRQDIGQELNADAAEDLRYISDSARRMQQLVADLLRLARAGSGGMQRVKTGLESCVRAALESVSLRVTETNASIVVEPLPEVEGDVTLLTQLFQNLLGNALKFTGSRRPALRVTCASEGGELVVGVQDNGIGMDPANCEKIFAPFQRLHGRDQYEGTGIGLTIARKVVERHGGRIWVESRPGVGSHFKFTLAGMLMPEPALT